MICILLIRFCCSSSGRRWWAPPSYSCLGSKQGKRSCIYALAWSNWSLVTVHSGRGMVTMKRIPWPLTGLQHWSVRTACNLRAFNQALMSNTVLSPDSAEDRSVWAKLRDLSERMRGLVVSSEMVGQKRRKRSVDSYPYFTFNEWVSKLFWKASVQQLVIMSQFGY